MPPKIALALNLQKSMTLLSQEVSHKPEGAYSTSCTRWKVSGSGEGDRSSAGISELHQTQNSQTAIRAIHIYPAFTSAVPGRKGEHREKTKVV